MQGKSSRIQAIERSSLKDSKSVEHVVNEKEALRHFTAREAKGINRLIHTFKDEQRLYMVLEPVMGLPLHKLLQMTGKLNSSFARLIIVQVGLILKDLHAN